MFFYFRSSAFFSNCKRHNQNMMAVFGLLVTILLHPLLLTLPNLGHSRALCDKPWLFKNNRLMNKLFSHIDSIPSTQSLTHQLATLVNLLFSLILKITTKTHYLINALLILNLFGYYLHLIWVFLIRCIQNKLPIMSPPKS